jgi:hypothetical protein
MSQSMGKSLYRMYATIVDRSGVDEAEKWRKKLTRGQKVQLAMYERTYVKEGEESQVWALENGE